MSIHRVVVLALLLALASIGCVGSPDAPEEPGEGDGQTSSALTASATGPVSRKRSTLATSAEWSPLDEEGVGGAALRFYTSSLGVTSAGTATRQRAGVQSATFPLAYSAHAGRLTAMDGVGFVELASGRMLAMGGAPGGQAHESVNAVHYSDDRGKTWSVLLANGPASSTRPAPAHTFGHFVMTIEGTEYVYWLGSDPFTPSGDVFRSADGGSTWERISTTCPTSGLSLNMYGVLGTDIYVIGGQTDIEDSGVPSRMVARSSDYGATWTRLPDAPASVFGAQVGPLPVLDGHLWIAGSARYSSGTTDFSNAVLKFDGTTWTTVLADGHAQFKAARYHAVTAYNGKLWRFNGSTLNGTTVEGDTQSALYSADGVTWTGAPWPLPWDNTHAVSAIGTSDGLYLTEGFQSGKLFVIREHNGSLASAWADQGAGGKTLLQATDASKPVVQANQFGSLPGIVGTGAEIMSLATPDEENAGGVHEAWVVMRTLNHDTAAAQGPNQPAVLVGNASASVWNSFGMDGNKLSYRSASPATSSFAGSGLNRDGVHLVGVQHSAGVVKLFVDGVQVGKTFTGAGFSKTYTGWDSILGGYLGADRAAVVLGAVIVRRASRPWSRATITKLNTWANRYRLPPSVSP